MKGRTVLILSGALICSVIVIFSIKYFADNKYRSQLPKYPDLQSVSKPVSEQLTTAGEKAKFNPSSENLGKLGMAYHSSANYEKAARCYELAIQKNKSKWIWSYYLGHLNQEQGEYENAVANFETVIAQNPESDMAIYYLGESYQGLNNSAEAEKQFSKIARNNQQDLESAKPVRENFFSLHIHAMFKIARIYMNANRLDDAETLLKKIIGEQIGFGPAYRQLGTIYALRGDSLLSNYYTVRAKDLAEFTPPADPLIDELILFSRSELYLLKEIDIAVNNNNLRWASQLCDHAMPYLSENKYLISKAIWVYLTVGRGADAVDLIDRHFSYFSEDYDELMKIAGLLFDNGFKSQALTYFNQAKKIKPDSAYLAIWLGQKGFNEEAFSLMKEQLTRDPENVEFISNAVMISMDRGEKAMVQQYLERLKKLAPVHLDVKRYEGYFAEEESQFEKAIAAWEDVFKGDPKDLYIINKLNHIYLKNKMWEKSYSLLKQAIGQSPNEPILLNEFGKLLFFCPDPKIKNVSESREYLERSFINISSDFNTKISAASNLSKVYAELGQKQNAEKYMDIAIKMSQKGSQRQ